MSFDIWGEDEVKLIKDIKQQWNDEGTVSVIVTIVAVLRGISKTMLAEHKAFDERLKKLESK